jgi:iron complex outermembrane receptor protein
MKKHPFYKIGLCSCIGMISTVSLPAYSSTTVDIGTVQATTHYSTASSKNVDSAPYQAPSKTPLHVSQPTSVVSQTYIKNNVVPTSNYDEIVKLTPSVTSISPNGPGMMENMGLSLRGFQDGEFNLTFDGLPIADSNDFTHHSTSYFMAHDIAQISVDRGPGTAATVGTSTFGGSISLQSQNPTAESSLNPYMMIGSYGTQLYGVQYNTGSLPQYNGATAVIDIEQLKSKGYLTNAGQRRRNIFTKIMKPISDTTTLTFAAMYNEVHQNVSLGATKAQIDKYGPNYGLSNDPTKQNYYGYNYDNIHVDFEYLDLQSLLDNGWTLDNKLYTYAYYHKGFNGADPNGETPNGTSWGANHVPGQKMGMFFRSFGNFLRMAKDTNSGKWNTGLWIDHQYNDRFEYDVDWTLNAALDNNKAGYQANRLMHDTLDNVQPYVEFAWKASPQLTVTPGLKYAYFRRTLDAKVNQGSHLPLNYSKSWSSALPSIDIHYKLQPNWVAYAQVAKGFLAPNLNTFYTQDPSKSNVKPEETWNYQIGTTWASRKLTLSADLYYINFKNKVGSRKIAANTIFYNQGGAIYKGIETESTYYLGQGVSFYGNATFNSAKTKDTHQWIANAPKTTAALGVMYDKNAWTGSIMDKYVGSRYGDSGETQKIKAYNTADMAVGYTVKGNGASWYKKAKISLKINNLLNKKSINALAGYTGQNNTPLYWTIPERSFYLSLSAHI